jgi:hypothetical protein
MRRGETAVGMAAGLNCAVPAPLADSPAAERALPPAGSAGLVTPALSRCRRGAVQAAVLRLWPAPRAARAVPPSLAPWGPADPSAGWRSPRFGKPATAWRHCAAGIAAPPFPRTGRLGNATGNPRGRTRGWRRSARGSALGLGMDLSAGQERMPPTQGNAPRGGACRCQPWSMGGPRANGLLNPMLGRCGAEFQAPARPGLPQRAAAARSRRRTILLEAVARVLRASATAAAAAGAVPSNVTGGARHTWRWMPARSSG